MQFDVPGRSAEAGGGSEKRKGNSALPWALLTRLRRIIGGLSRRPLRISAAGWLQILLRVWRNSRRSYLNVIAAGVAFYAFLALLPSLASVALAYSLFAGPETVLDHLEAVLVVVPGAAEELLARRLSSFLAGRSYGPVGLAISASLTLYSIAKAARSLIGGLNLIYECPRREGLLIRWGIGLAVATCGGCFVLLILFAVALDGYIEPYLEGGLRFILYSGRLAFWAAAVLAGTAALALLYRYGPAGRSATWRTILPGAVVAVALAAAATIGLGAYVGTVDRLDALYGSAATVVVIQLWLYVFALAVLVGAKFDAEIERFITPYEPSRPEARTS